MVIKHLLSGMILQVSIHQIPLVPQGLDIFKGQLGVPSTPNVRVPTVFSWCSRLGFLRILFVTHQYPLYGAYIGIFHWIGVFELFFQIHQEFQEPKIGGFPEPKKTSYFGGWVFGGFPVPLSLTHRCIMYPPSSWKKVSTSRFQVSSFFKSESFYFLPGWWLEWDCFLFGWRIFRGKKLGTQGV